MWPQCCWNSYQLVNKAFNFFFIDGHSHLLVGFCLYLLFSSPLTLSLSFFLSPVLALSYSSSSFSHASPSLAVAPCWVTLFCCFMRVRSLSSSFFLFLFFPHSLPLSFSFPLSLLLVSLLLFTFSLPPNLCFVIPLPCCLSLQVPRLFSFLLSLWLYMCFVYVFMFSYFELLFHFVLFLFLFGVSVCVTAALFF